MPSSASGFRYGNICLYDFPGATGVGGSSRPSGPESAPLETLLGDTRVPGLGPGCVHQRVARIPRRRDDASANRLVASRPTPSDRARFPVRVDTLKIDFAGASGLGRDVRGGTWPRLSWGRSVL